MIHYTAPKKAKRDAAALKNTGDLDRKQDTEVLYKLIQRRTLAAH